MTFRHVLLLFSDRSPAPFPFFAWRAASRRRGGLTLIELMVAIAVTLLLMGAVVSLFGFLGDTINDSKADIEMLERLRQVTDLLQTDLASLTLRLGPPQRGREQAGCFEYVEGHSSELEDMLHCTIRSRGEPLTGKIDTTLVPIGADAGNAGSAQNVGISTGSSVSAGAGGSPANVLTESGYITGFSGQSRLAEVIWFVTVDPLTGRGRLHRHQLLIAADADLTDVDTAGEIETFLAQNDISSTLQPSGAVVANSLEALALRENRRAHQDGGGSFVPFYSFADMAQYPTELDVAVQLFMLVPPADPSTLSAATKALLLSRLDETIVLDNVTAFDVKAWDPGAQKTSTIIDGFSTLQSGGLSLSTTDGTWRGVTNTTIAGGVFTRTPTTAGGTVAQQQDNEHLTGQMVNLSKIAGLAGSTVTLSFDYNTGAGNTIYVHLRAVDDDADPAALSWSVNTGASNGNAWNSISGGLSYVLFDGTSGGGGGGSEAVTLTGSGTFSQTIDLSGYALTDISEYEFLMLGFALDSTSVNPVTVSNLNLSVQVGGYGTYVDLNYGFGVSPAIGLNSTFSGPGTTNLVANFDPNSPPLRPATYDTWSAAYGYLAADGYDSDADGVVDDADEATPAPYPVPLKGIQVRLRVQEPSSGTERTVTIRQRFDN